MGWLDALRGIAALTVALHHFGLRYFVPYGTKAAHHFDLGIFGVMLFFLVSGYIVPASLERRGDVRAFWIGRAFRIYPVLIVIVVAASVILARAPHSMIDASSYAHPLVTLPANALMLQDMLGQPSVITVMWTLCYEMVFYYFVTALFVLGQHRRSGSIAVGFAAIALFLGGALTPLSLTDTPLSSRHLLLAGALVVVMGMACVLSGNPALTRTGAMLLGGLGVVLIFTNGRSAPFETMMIFATMFAGTVIYRAEHGQIDRLQAGFYCGFVMIAGPVCAWMYDRSGDALWRTWTPSWTAWALAYAGAWVAFALAMSMRGLHFPRALTWLGAVSYSVYLIHWLVIDCLDWQFGMPWLFAGSHAPRSPAFRLLFTASFLISVVALSYLTYRLVELPGQKLGRRLLKAVSPRPTRPSGSPNAAVPGSVDATEIAAIGRQAAHSSLQPTGQGPRR